MTKPPFSEQPSRYLRTPRAETDLVREANPIEHFPQARGDRAFGLALILVGVLTLVAFVADLFLHFLPPSTP